MSSITIRDLSHSLQLDRQAMAHIRGSGAPWVFGWIRPFVEREMSFGSVINFYQINNFAEQMTNQFQTVKIDNAGNNANILVNLNEQASNVKNV